MNESNLKKTRNWYRCVGTVYEKALNLEDCQVTIYEDGRPTDKKVPAECIKGNVAIRIPSGTITFPIYFASIGLNGKDSRDWKMASAMYNNWNPEVNGDGSEPTAVALEGVIEGNDYVAQTGEAKYTVRYRVRRANTRVQPDEPHGMTISATTFIRNIKPEIRNEEETGRLMVELYGVNNKGACFPINTIVEADLADDFNDNFEVNQTVPVDIDVVVQHIGAKQNNKKRAFGRKGSINTNTGFDVTELIIVGADDPIEEPEELTYEDDEGNVKEIETDWINPVTMKKAFKARDIMIEEMVKNGPAPSKSSYGGKSIKDMKRERKMAKTKARPSYDEDDDEDDDF